MLADSITAMVDRTSGAKLEGAFGTNAWLVEEMYESYLADPESVSESWREFVGLGTNSRSRAPRRRRAIRRDSYRAPGSAEQPTRRGRSGR